jgi:hypothetical protein
MRAMIDKAAANQLGLQVVAGAFGGGEGGGAGCSTRVARVAVSAIK